MDLSYCNSDSYSINSAIFIKGSVIGKHNILKKSFFLVSKIHTFICCKREISKKKKTLNNPKTAHDRPHVILTKSSIEESKNVQGGP